MKAFQAYKSFANISFALVKMALLNFAIGLNILIIHYWHIHIECTQCVVTKREYKVLYVHSQSNRDSLPQQIQMILTLNLLPCCVPLILEELALKGLMVNQVLKRVYISKNILLLDAEHLFNRPLPSLLPFCSSVSPSRLQHGLHI